MTTPARIPAPLPVPAASVRPVRRGPRGWLLIEVAIGGVMASVILGAVLVNLGQATNQSVSVGRAVTAQMLAQQGIEQARALSSPLTNPALADSPQGGEDVPVPTSLRGNYKRTRMVTSGSTTTNGKSFPYKEIAVTVTFKKDGKDQSTTMRTRIYTGT